jgi:hypothetical protein
VQREVDILHPPAVSIHLDSRESTRKEARSSPSCQFSFLLVREAQSGLKFSDVCDAVSILSPLIMGDDQHHVWHSVQIDGGYALFEAGWRYVRRLLSKRKSMSVRVM